MCYGNNMFISCSKDPLCFTNERVDNPGQNELSSSRGLHTPSYKHMYNRGILPPK